MSPGALARRYSALAAAGLGRRAPADGPWGRRRRRLGCIGGLGHRRPLAMSRRLAAVLGGAGGAITLGAGAAGRQGGGAGETAISSSNFGPVGIEESQRGGRENIPLEW